MDRQRARSDAFSGFGFLLSVRYAGETLKRTTVNRR